MSAIQTGMKSIKPSSPSVAVAVFAKTIGLSPVKTRLATSIGSTRAEQFYRLSINCAEQCLTRAQAQYANIEVFWATAEQQAADHAQWRGRQTLWTGEGALGQRLHHVYQQLKQRYDIVILLGSDCPQLPSQRILEAIQNVNALDRPCIGPAADGGFYLFAGKDLIPQHCWTDVGYSASDTLQQLLTGLKCPVQLLEPCFDIDTIEDLSALTSPLFVDATVAQSHLNAWLHTQRLR